MAEEKDIKKEEVRETEKVVEKVVEKPVTAEDTGIDKEAIEEILRGQGETSEKLKTMEKDIGDAKGAQEKLSQLSQILTGDTEEAKKEKIFREFAEDPEAMLKKYAGGKNETELAEIRGTLEKIKFEKADQSAMSRLSSGDPDYEVVMKNIGDMTTEEERKKYQGDEGRLEILYGLTKSRMAGKIAESKVSAEEAKTDAINESNKSAVSEKPGGKEVEEPTERDKRDEEIAKARESWDSDKVSKLATERLLEDSDFLKKWELDE